MTDILSMLANDPNVAPELRAILDTQGSLPIRRAEYVSALLKHDWQFDYSDDHRVWTAGRDETKRLRLERAVVDPDHALWKKHAHESYRHE